MKTLARASAYERYTTPRVPLRRILKNRLLDARYALGDIPYNLRNLFRRCHDYRWDHHDHLSSEQIWGNRILAIAIVAAIAASVAATHFLPRTKSSEGSQSNVHIEQPLHRRME